MDVTIVEPKPNILGFLDDDVVASLKTRMQALHITFRMPAQVWGCESTEAGVRLSLDSGDTLAADCVLVCAGRQGNTGGLGLELAGLEVNKRGQLTVDPVTFTTKVPHIAAVGDVIGFPALASTSMEQPSDVRTQRLPIQMATENFSRHSNALTRCRDVVSSSPEDSRRGELNDKV